MRINIILGGGEVGSREFFILFCFFGWYFKMTEIPPSFLTHGKLQWRREKNNVRKGELLK